MRFAVEEINNSSTLLPGISLGYEMVDVCYLTNIVHPVLYFLADNHYKVHLQQNYTRYRPRVLAVVGPDSSPGAVTVANILSSFLIPQVSRGPCYCWANASEIPVTVGFRTRTTVL